jgi:hypothetical protein
LAKRERNPEAKPQPPAISAATRHRIGQLSWAVFIVTLAGMLSGVIDPRVEAVIMVLLAVVWLRWIAV